MTLEFHCAICGTGLLVELQLNKTRPEMTLGAIIKKHKYIVQMNGTWFDIFCSKKCAK